MNSFISFVWFWKEYGSVQDAEECVNDLFVTVWQDFDSFDPARGSLRTWLTMRAKYIALDRRRHLTRRNPSGTLVVSHPADQHASHDLSGADDLSRETDIISQRMDTSLDTLLEQRERREEVRRALERLPDLDRLLVYLRYFQLASIDEIAQRTKSVEACCGYAALAGAQEPSSGSSGAGP